MLPRSSGAISSGSAARSTSHLLSSTIKPGTITFSSSSGIPRRTLSEWDNQACRRERDWASRAGRAGVPACHSDRIPPRRSRILNSRRNSSFYGDRPTRGREDAAIAPAPGGAGVFVEAFDLLLSYVRLTRRTYESVSGKGG